MAPKTHDKPDQVVNEVGHLQPTQEKSDQAVDRNISLREAPTKLIDTTGHSNGHRPAHNLVTQSNLPPQKPIEAPKSYEELNKPLMFLKN